jgi:hypothetical protein
MAGATRPPIGAKALEERIRGVNHGAAIGMNRPCKARIIRRRDLRRTSWARRRVCTRSTGAEGESTAQAKSHTGNAE